jgi:hypothetical protein
MDACVHDLAPCHRCFSKVSLSCFWSLFRKAKDSMTIKNSISLESSTMTRHQEKLRLALQKANLAKPHHQKRQQQGLLEGNEAQSLFTVRVII